MSFDSNECRVQPSDCRPDPQPAISVRGLGKCYELYDRPIDRLKQTLFRGRRRFHREFWAIRNVSFDLQPGKAIGIIGRNGSGKSTLLQIIAGTLRPTVGEVDVQGRVAALLELGSGFNFEFTGRENAYLNGSILGLSPGQVHERFDEIAAFADIGEFMDQPVKTYSTGMVVRLAFAVQVLLEPDILIVDEALSVGDAVFQAKCFRRIEQLRNKGVTILLATHDMTALQAVCQTAILLQEGTMVAHGPVKTVAAEYYRRVQDTQRLEMPSAAIPAAAPESNGGLDPLGRGGGERLGNGAAEVFGFAVYDHKGQKTLALQARELFSIDLGVRFKADLENPQVGVALRDVHSRTLLGGHTMYEGIRLGPVRAGQEVVVSFKMQLGLNPGRYPVMFGVADHQAQASWTDCDVFFDYCVIEVFGEQKAWGLVNMPVEISVKGLPRR